MNSEHEKLQELLDKVDAHDNRIGSGAYHTYHRVMRRYADEYRAPFVGTVEAFAALSPNNDYHGNLRSLAGVLSAYRAGDPVEAVTVSTYKGCARRAMGYLTGETSFLDTVGGRKITSFRHNILYPATSRVVTVDGHMVAASRGLAITMTEANKIIRKPGVYDAVEKAVQYLARGAGMTPCGMQAVIWLTRKRVLNVKYDAQTDMLSRDVWKMDVDPAEYPPFKRKTV